MAFYNTCPKCGAHLDPGEKCDCEGLVPVTLKEANAFLERRHRRHKAVTGHKFSIAASGRASAARPSERIIL